MITEDLTKLKTVKIIIKADTKKLSIPALSDEGERIHFNKIKYPRIINQQPMSEVHKDQINYCYPNDIHFKTPSYPDKFARLDDTTLLIGPPADIDYEAEIYGIID